MYIFAGIQITTTVHDVESIVHGDIWMLDLGPPPPPGHLRVDSVSRDQIVVSWVDPFRFQQKRKVRIDIRELVDDGDRKVEDMSDDERGVWATVQEVSDPSGNLVVIKYLGQDPTTSERLKPGAEYEIRVVAYNQLGQTSASDLADWVVEVDESLLSESEKADKELHRGSSLVVKTLYKGTVYTSSMAERPI
jgi:hypothetical protein